MPQRDSTRMTGGIACRFQDATASPLSCSWWTLGCTCTHWWSWLSDVELTFSSRFRATFLCSVGIVSARDRAALLNSTCTHILASLWGSTRHKSANTAGCNYQRDPTRHGVDCSPVSHKLRPWRPLASEGPSASLMMSMWAHLVLLDERKAVGLEEGGAAVDGVRVPRVDLHRLLFVDGCVSCLGQLRLQELCVVVALNLLHSNFYLFSK